MTGCLLCASGALVMSLMSLCLSGGRSNESGARSDIWERAAQICLRALKWRRGREDERGRKGESQRTSWTLAVRPSVRPHCDQPALCVKFTGISCCVVYLAISDWLSAAKLAKNKKLWIQSGSFYSKKKQSCIVYIEMVIHRLLDKGWLPHSLFCYKSWLHTKHRFTHLPQKKHTHTLCRFLMHGLVLWAVTFAFLVMENNQNCMETN